MNPKQIIAITITLLFVKAPAQLQTLGFDPPTSDPSVKITAPKIDGPYTLEMFGQTKTVKKIMDLLTETRATIEYGKVDKQGKITAFFGSGSVADTHLVAVHTFCQYMPVRIGTKKYALGIKTAIRADFSTNAKGINIASLFNIGLSASQNKIAGTIQVMVSGISGPKINDYISMPAKLDEATISQALQNFAVIKSKLFDGETTIVPTIIGELTD